MREREFFRIDLVPFAGCRLLHVTEPSINLLFTAGKRIEQSLKTIDLIAGIPGRGMDFSLTALGIPVVSDVAAALLERYARDDVQLFDARIALTSEALKLVNIVNKIDAMDRGSSRVAQMSGPLGTLQIPDFRIDPALAERHKIFRLAVNLPVIVMHPDLIDRIIEARILGPGLTRMDGSGAVLKPGEAAEH